MPIEAKEKIHNIADAAMELVSALSKKEREVLVFRFGLGNEGPQTLAAVGRKLGVTRERVRQIEVLAKKAVGRILVRSTEFDPKLDSIVLDLGGVAEGHRVAKRLKISNQNELAALSLLLETAPNIQKIKKSKNVKECFVLSEIGQKKVLEMAKEAREMLEAGGKPVSLSQISKKLAKECETSREFASAAMECFSEIGVMNGKAGLTSWREIVPRSVRDKAYIVLKRHNKPAHYKKIVQMIKAKNFDKKRVNPHGVHNELVRDPRFVLVGRGIYALRELGFKEGTVQDVIREILEETGNPISKTEIIKKVLERKIVNKNTIILNLQEKNDFVRMDRGVYGLKKWHSAN